MFQRITVLLVVLCIASGCTGYVPPPAYSICSTRPGTMACQVDQYKRVD